ncbi:MAG TPA: hypothetical protein PKW95_19370 [bacterium]|nr:hypothetical protein [bacterium]
MPLFLFARADDDSSDKQRFFSGKSKVMSGKFFLLMAICCLVWALAVPAFAQENDDDTTDDDTMDDDASDDDATDDDTVPTFADSTVEMTGPVALEANTEYEFSFEVFNAAVATADKGVWIRQVEFVLPEGYLVKEEELQGPPCLHPGKYCTAFWDVQYDATTLMITWQSLGSVTTEEYGDIREQDVQTFTFNAITDEGPTDGFNWILTGDDGTTVSDTAYIGGADDDVDPDEFLEGEGYGHSNRDEPACGC